MDLKKDDGWCTLKFVGSPAVEVKGPHPRSHLRDCTFLKDYSIIINEKNCRRQWQKKKASRTARVIWFKK